ncbi:hypothetical protein BRM1_12855 [Brevibacterium sp. BRM-1]|uniref:hypothetical protein n=1 Tax=Brevibacterium sp. BRM-1 TaxID=2999062 RepID=UPI002280D603|nr:hypothetical protein [Brevibacterium sp. BRM-1]WAL40100.1 hypothetical protein BRM1_12855 [Brevibacterium sp. BRM-1]
MSDTGAHSAERADGARWADGPGRPDRLEPADEASPANRSAARTRHGDRRDHVADGGGRSPARGWDRPEGSGGPSAGSPPSTAEALAAARLHRTGQRAPWRDAQRSAVIARRLAGCCALLGLALIALLGLILMNVV